MYGLHVTELNYSEEELSDIIGLMPDDIKSELLGETDVIKVRQNRIQLKF
jgi:hypothetical protein